MATKTITVTEQAYEALKARKGPKDSFSETILRVAGKGSLREFAGVLSKQSADRLEQAIKKQRKRHAVEHEKRMQRISKKLQGL
jgi:predicted CopG family antitoxin